MRTQVELRGSERYCLFDTAIGPCGVAWSGEGLTRLNLPEHDRATTGRRLGRRGALEESGPPPAVEQTIVELQRYCAGARVDFSSAALDMTRIEPFARRVYAAARTIGWGCTTTYGELARRIGSPGEARAVGQALSQNPIPIIIPCHRVLAKDGMGGFSAYGGASAKERLLALEGVRFEKQMVLAW